MAKQNRLPPFVALYKDLLASKEWRNLSSSAKVVYVYMRGKFNTVTLSEVSLTYSEMADMMSSATVSKGFKELQDAGFIKKENHGGLFRGPTTYTFNGKFGAFHYKGTRT